MPSHKTTVEPTNYSHSDEATVREGPILIPVPDVQTSSRLCNQQEGTFGRNETQEHVTRRSSRVRRNNILYLKEEYDLS